MHIVWIHRNASMVGGAERYVHETATRLRGRGVRSTLLYDVSSRVSAEMSAAFDGIYPLVEPEAQLRALAPDAVYVHGLEGEHVAARLRAGTDAPIVRYFHDHKLFCLREHKVKLTTGAVCREVASARTCYPCLGFARPSSGPFPLRLKSIRTLEAERAASADFDAFVAPSRYLAQELARHGLDAERTFVLSPVPHEPMRLSATRQVGHLLFVGSLVHGKGVDVLLRALARVPAAPRLSIVGDGESRARLEALAEKLGVAGRVTFRGHLGGEALERAYATASIAVVPSRVPETFGLSGLEASARGLAVVASDVGGVREWLDPGRTGVLVPPDDVDALALVLDALVRDAALVARLGGEGVAHARDRFSGATHDERLLAILGGASVVRRAA